ncbi:hypothetical protein N7468_002729 [Penicillium chermesinum]|uniref:WD repeat protein n=1 Tax=Penicillium chermesinum TaxID=63820 RepID=A0A9W9TXT7_9EURO|nr:uncharacterized protein N7468_002729 [Penicillium chermesinum]KAJ5247746.1 hypothetical protein N7468_002729 [Penicillium chermesinum]
MSLERLGTCVPITALKAFVWKGSNYIFQGQGPFFQVIDAISGDVVAQARVFRRNNVHGFIPLTSSGLPEDSNLARIIVWGGQSVRMVEVHVAPHATIYLTLASAEFLSPDWIMNGCPASDDQPHTAYLITANNAPLKLDLRENPSSSYHTEIYLSQLATSVKSILCAADLVALSASHLLIAAGTIFGEIIIWSCFMEQDDFANPRLTSSIHHFFTGHDGTVFGVRISPQIPSLKDGKPGRLLASCSDDRTVRIWDISGCETKTSQEPSAYSTDGFGLRSTGFSIDAPGDPENASESCVAKAFGHSARIWDIKFRPLKPDGSAIGLVTRGEDCTCVVWDLAWHSSSGEVSYQLIEKSSIKNHSGKHIWSFDLWSNSRETVVYSGGADGALKTFKISEAESQAEGGLSTKSNAEKPQGLAAFVFVASDQIIVCTTEGELHLGCINPGMAVSVTWETLCVLDNISSPILMTGIPERNLALISDSKGRVKLYNHNSRSVADLADLGRRPIGMFSLHSNPPVDAEAQSLSFVVSYDTHELATLVTAFKRENDSFKTEKVDFTLPGPRFTISSASFAWNEEYLLLGSKLGGFTVYQTQGLTLSSCPLLIERRLHGSEGTNHIQVLPNTKATGSQELEYLLTCGRDGNFCLHEFKPIDNQRDEISLETVHRTTSGLVGNIEGAYFDQITGDLMIYGFKMQNFVLRNESQQRDIVSIASGGARRLWAFQPGTKANSGPLLLWRERSELKGWRIQMDMYQSLRAGVHGREIKSVDIFNDPQGARSLFATGAEDTLVQIYAPLSTDNAGPWGSFQCLRTLNTHRAGIQQVKWSNDGNFLFTSSAYEEFFVWGTKWIPYFGLATVLKATAPKSDPKSELRLTSFDVVTIDDSSSHASYLICMTVSNSTIKIFHFSPENDNCFTLLATGRYMTNCLTQCHVIRKESSLSLITASTDGYFIMWDLTHVLEPYYKIEASALTVKTWPEGADFEPVEIKCEDRFQIHSNSVKAMDVALLSEEAAAILSGGDDNRFAVSVLQTKSDGPSVATVSIPDAHAASVTTTLVLAETIKQTPTGFQFTVVSSGNDHRVKLWSVTLEFSATGQASVAIELVLDRYSSVADISSSGLLSRMNTSNSIQNSQPPTDRQSPKLLICGVGIEMFELDL